MLVKFVIGRINFLETFRDRSGILSIGFLHMWRNYGHARAINRGLTLRNETNMAVSRRDFVWTKTKKTF